jgi:hypothetical protein
MLATLQTAYGYVLTIGGPVDEGPSLAWDDIPPTFGFVSRDFFNEIIANEKAGICRFAYQLLKHPMKLPRDQDDLNDQNHLSLSLLFNWKHLTRVSDDLFVFHSPVSSACKWSLGVQSPSIALYVC